MSAHAFTVTTPQQQHKVTTRFRLSAATDKDDDRQEVIFVDPGNEGDAISQDLWEEIEGAQPPKWLVMKELLGISGFTYALGALIVLMLSLNTILGPGWLGQAVGIAGTGTFTDVSPSLPDQVDLSEYLL